MCPLFCFQISPVLGLGANYLRPTSSHVKPSSVVKVQIFDQRKFKRRDKGFLGFVEIRVADYLDLELGGHGMFLGFRIASPLQLPMFFPRRASCIRPEGHQRKTGRARQTDISPVHQPYHISYKFPTSRLLIGFDIPPTK